MFFRDGISIHVLIDWLAGFTRASGIQRTWLRLLKPQSSRENTMVSTQFLLQVAWAHCSLCTREDGSTSIGKTLASLISSSSFTIGSYRFWRHEPLPVTCDPRALMRAHRHGRDKTRTT